MRPPARGHAQNKGRAVNRVRRAPPRAARVAWPRRALTSDRLCVHMNVFYQIHFAKIGSGAKKNRAAIFQFQENVDLLLGCQVAELCMDKTMI